MRNAMDSQVLDKSRLTRRLPLVLIIGWLVVLFIAGGASRADVPGQLIVRTGAWGIVLAIVLLRIPLRSNGLGWTGGLLIAAVLAPTSQLIPLPPAIWTGLPGRELLVEAANVSGQAQPWRPISISPSTTINALASLIVPIATFLLVLTVDRTDRERLLGFLIVFVFCCAFFALLQAGGMSIQSPFVNYRDGATSGPFANRNHMATLCAIGCLAVPVWAARRQRFSNLTAVGVVSGVFFLVFVGLATGSRAGIPLMVIGIAAGLWLSRAKFVALFRKWTRRSAVFAGIGVIVAAAATLLAFIFSGRALSIERAMNWQVMDVRAELIPVTFDLAQKYFPFGTGFGTFDHAFRIDEPTEMLMVQHYNLAHNDLLQIVLDGGLVGGIILAAAIAAWLFKTRQTFRAATAETQVLKLVASVAIGLVILSSMVDYPARTPIFMAWLVVFAVLLETRAPTPVADTIRAATGQYQSGQNLE
ncbi:MAG: O-antigen ligase family protein [Erythrobacter sp.]